MSEDSIASDSVSCRTEAPLLPPRKRLLAGLKQNGWSSPSSSSCAAALTENLQVIEPLPHSSSPKLEELDQSSIIDAVDGPSSQSPYCASESVDSHQRKSKRVRASSLLKNSSKKRKKASLEDESVKDLDSKNLTVVDDKGVKALDAMSLPANENVEGGEDVDAVIGRVCFEIEKHATGSEEREAQVDKKEDREALVEHVTALKSPSNPRSSKEGKELNCDEANKPSRNPSNKAKKGETRVIPFDETQKPRRNPNRHPNSRNKDADSKKPELKQGRNSQIPLSLADEELARQLHRAMNSSPRIARCLSHKEERPLLSPSRKHYPGS